MNSHNKIYDFEVTPPAGVWNAIANKLDEWDQEKIVAEKLGQLETIPPAGLWDKVSKQLDDMAQEQNLSNQLYHLEAAVPETAWANISRELDDQKALEIIEHKLSNLQIQPPLSVWSHIQNELEGKKSDQSLVVPMHHGWLKYAAAACFITMISISAYFILRNEANNGSEVSLASNTINQAENNSSNIAATPIALPQVNTADTRQKVMAGIRTKLGNAYTVSNEKNNDLHNRYIILMTQDGNIVRMSKKVGNMADCIAGEDHSCDDQLSKWQKEMASSTATVGPNNFLDILDIASQEETETTKPNM